MSITRDDAELIEQRASNILTPEEVKIVAQNYTNDKLVNVIGHQIVNYSDILLGFGGDYKTLKITVKKSNATNYETAKFFVKSMPYYCKQQSDFLMDEGIFHTESDFYKTLLPQLTRNFVGEKWYAASYLAKKDAIVMEDLRLQNYRLLGKFFDDFMTIKSVIASLASFHSSSIIAEFRLSQGKERLVTLNESYPDLFKEKMYTRTGILRAWIDTSADVTCSIAKRLNCYTDRIKKAYDQIFEMAKPSDIHRNVICHGSLWCNNIMFADNEPLKNCILIDFQFMKYAPLVTDLLQFLHLNSTRKFRQAHEQELIEFYHSILEKTIKINDPTSSIKVPTLEEIICGMNDLRIFGLVVPTMYFPVILMDSNFSSEYFHSGDKYAFKEHVYVTLAHMKENDFLRNFFGDAVIELTSELERKKADVS